MEQSQWLYSALELGARVGLSQDHRETYKLWNKFCSTKTRKLIHSLTKAPNQSPRGAAEPFSQPHLKRRHSPWFSPPTKQKEWPHSDREFSENFSLLRSLQAGCQGPRSHPAAFQSREAEFIVPSMAEYTQFQQCSKPDQRTEKPLSSSYSLSWAKTQASTLLQLLSTPSTLPRH